MYNMCVCIYIYIYEIQSDLDGAGPARRARGRRPSEPARWRSGHVIIML